MQANNIHAGQSARPQNPVYPAGGTNSSDLDQRGVLVAPPSGNTSQAEPYQVLHRGFDTLAVSIKAHIPPALYEYLDGQKAIAEAEQKDVLVEWNGIKLHLKGHGGKGYRFIASGGPYGANWAFKIPNAKDPWGIRVSFGSTFLATLGLGAAKAHLDRALQLMGIRTRPDDFSMSRVDYCVDVLASGFELIPEQFVMHSGANRRDHLQGFDHAVNGKSGRVTSVTIGNPRARQVIVYDKRLEVIQRQKAHWWAIWNETRIAQGMLPLDPKDRSQGVWRVEYRAGKDLLKDNWNIRTWDDLFTRFGDLCAHSANAVRYTEPNGDSNRARWPNHPLWDIAAAEVSSDLIEMREGADPNPIKLVQKEQHIATLLKNIRGTAITYAALHGEEFATLPAFCEQIGQKLSKSIQSEPEHCAKLLQNAKDRYAFITESGH